MSQSGLAPQEVASRRSVIDTLELDVRLLGMLMAFAAVAIVFTIWTGGTFVGPRNVFNIAVQTVPVAIMACGMVFVIVARHIDLSVGSMLAMCSAIMAMSQTSWLPSLFGTEFGLPISVLILIAVGVIMTVVARKTTFGRYIFAMGGNPDAAELSGINTRALTVKIFALMGFLCALAALVAQARLQSHGNDIGMLEELRVIAAAVIGGTALAGGVGTIDGAILGALIMQSLQSGMAMVGVDTPFQNIIVGLVLIIAVWVDILYRKRLGLSK